MGGPSISTAAPAASSPAPPTWRTGWSCRPTTAVRVDGTRVLSDSSLTEQHTAGSAARSYALGWNTDGPLGAPTRLEHTGNLLTYSAYMEVLPESGYGVVVLLNAGSGLMLDQIGIFYGVRSIVEGTDLSPPGPAGATFNVTTIDRILGLLTLVVALLGARGILRAGRWARRRRQQPWAYTAARMAPYLAVLGAALVYPQLAERLARRPRGHVGGSRVRVACADRLGLDPARRGAGDRGCSCLAPGPTHHLPRSSRRTASSPPPNFKERDREHRTTQKRPSNRLPSGSGVRRDIP